MQLVRDWLDGFLDGHFGHHDGATWHEWMRGLIDVKATKPEAEQAMARLKSRGEVRENPSRWLEALVIEIGIIRSTPKATQAAPIPLSQLDEAQRLDAADKALSELYTLGWEFRWYADEDQFRCHRSTPGAPRPSPELSSRLRDLRLEVYQLLGREEEPILDIDEFRDASGVFQWRLMVEALSQEMVKS